MSGYAIRGGDEGRRRLDLLARTMAPNTEALLARAGIRVGMRCIDLGCGGGHVSRYLAQRVLDQLSLSQQTGVDPADRVTLDEEVSEALLILLQRLSPAERVSFVLHDVFQLPFGQVAEILGKPTATCRQLAKRARDKVAGGPEATKRELADHELHKLSQTFLAACANGDLQALTAVLHNEVWGVADFTIGDPPQLLPRRSSAQVQRGADRIARSLLRFFGGNVTLVSAPAASGLAFLAFLERLPYATITATVEDARLTSMHVVVNRDALRAGSSLTSRARK